MMVRSAAHLARRAAHRPSRSARSAARPRPGTGRHTGTPPACAETGAPSPAAPAAAPSNPRPPSAAPRHSPTPTHRRTLANFVRESGHDGVQYASQCRASACMPLPSCSCPSMHAVQLSCRLVRQGSLHLCNVQEIIKIIPITCLVSDEVEGYLQLHQSMPIRNFYKVPHVFQFVGPALVRQSLLRSRASLGCVFMVQGPGEICWVCG